MSYVSKHIIALLLVLPFSCTCQTYIFKALIGKDISKIEKELVINEPAYSGIKGSPYLYDDYCVGYVLFQDSFYNFPQIKYNIFEQQIELIYHGANKYIPMNKIASFALINPYNNEVENYFNTDNIKFKETKLEGFVQKIKAKDYNLFVHHSVFLKNPIENASFMGESLESKFVNKNSFFLEQKNWLYLMKNQRDVTNVINRSQRSRADQYIDKNKLKFKKLEDYIEFFTYLGSTKSSI